MPLSDREQQILDDIEARLRADDPKFAQTVASSTVSKHQRRRIRLSLAAFALGFVMMLLLIVHLAFGIIGFAMMLTGAVVAAESLKKLGQAEGPLADQLRGGLERYRQDRRDNDGR